MTWREVASGRDQDGARILVLRAARRLEVRRYTIGPNGHPTFKAVTADGTPQETEAHYRARVAQLRGRVVEVRVP